MKPTVGEKKGRLELRGRFLRGGTVLRVHPKGKIYSCGALLTKVVPLAGKGKDERISRETSDPPGRKVPFRKRFDVGGKVSNTPEGGKPIHRKGETVFRRGVPPMCHGGKKCLSPRRRPLACLKSRLRKKEDTI